MSEPKHSYPVVCKPDQAEGVPTWHHTDAVADTQIARIWVEFIRSKHRSASVAAIYADRAFGRSGLGVIPLGPGCPVKSWGRADEGEITAGNLVLVWYQDHETGHMHVYSGAHTYEHTAEILDWMVELCPEWGWK